VRRRSAEIIGWGIATTTVLAGISGVTAVLRLSESDGLPPSDLGPQFVLSSGFAIVGALVVSARGRSAIGWVWLGSGAAGAASMLAWPYAQLALVVDPGSLRGGTAAAWISSWVWLLSAPVIVTLGLLQYPDGAPLSRRWRRFAWFVALGLGAAVFTTMLRSGPLQNHPVVDNPLGVASLSPVVTGAVDALFPAFFLVSFAGSVLSLVVRWLRADPASLERRRVTLFAVASLVLLVVVSATWSSKATLAVMVVNTLAAGLLPAAAGFTVLRDRLSEIDLALWRTIAYGASLALLGAFYAGLVWIAESWTGTDVAGLAAVGTALAALPAFRVAAQFANRLLFGTRDDPYVTVAALAASLQRPVDSVPALDFLAERVATALHLPHVAIEVDGQVRGTHGEAAQGERAAFALVHGGESVGSLIAEARSGNQLGQRDRDLLEVLSRTSAPSVQSSLLVADLAAARSRLVVAQEEERRRLRRDLHDGLGPTLAGIGLGLDLAGQTLDTDPQAARVMLGEVRGELAVAVGEVRRLVEGLRPPALEDLGLVEALTTHAATVTARAGDLRVEVEPIELPTIPAAIETAAYLIAVEAVTNTVKHAHARNCRVRLSLNGALDVIVHDDGVGRGKSPAGTGIRAMRERAAEVNGTVSVSTADGGGTVVHASLPTGQVTRAMMGNPSPTEPIDGGRTR
jgi:two-component system, NarL family, sensor kinase